MRVTKDTVPIMRVKTKLFEAFECVFLSIFCLYDIAICKKIPDKYQDKSQQETEQTGVSNGTES